jgi:hypothetical protein
MPVELEVLQGCFAHRPQREPAEDRQPVPRHLIAHRFVEVVAVAPVRQQRRDPSRNLQGITRR